jgi:hypothetical protein
MTFATGVSQASVILTTPHFPVNNRAMNRRTLIGFSARSSCAGADKHSATRAAAWRRRQLL